MSKFLEMDTTKEFISALSKDESQRANMLIAENQLIIRVKGRTTKNGNNPAVFRQAI